MTRIFTKQFYIDSFSVLKETGSEFSENRVFKMAAALSYYTIFAMAPLLIILMGTIALVWGEDAARGRIFGELNDIIGPDAAATIQSIVQNLDVGEGSTIATIIGVGTLAFSATKVFIDMQDTLNLIFEVRPKPKRGWVKMVLDRLLSFSIILSMAFILVVSFVVSGAIVALSTSITDYLPNVEIFGYNLFDDTTIYALTIINMVITFFVFSFLFGCIFKFLPDIKIRWKDVRAGAFFTAFLFMLGEWGIGLYLTNAAPGSAYGAAGTLIVILLWVFYAAIILYLGAVFTKVNAEMFGKGIAPSSMSVKIAVKEQKIADGASPEQLLVDEEEDQERNPQDPSYPNA